MEKMVVNEEEKYFLIINKIEELKDYCYGLICEACILKYDSKELGIDDVSETDEVVDEL